MTDKMEEKFLSQLAKLENKVIDAERKLSSERDALMYLIDNIVDENPSPTLLRRVVATLNKVF